MANIRYRNEFYSTEGTFWKIDIIDTSFSGSPAEFTCTAPNFTLSYKGNKERFDPIITSELRVSAWVQDAAFETFILDIAGANEQRFFAKLYKDSVFQWGGMMLVDDIQKEDIAFPYEFEMVFTDGLGTLKDKLFWDTDATPDALWQGKETFIEFIIKLLAKTGTAELWSGSDDFLATNVQWYDVHHNFYLNADPLQYSKIAHEAFYEYENKENKAGDCYDILQELLYTFGARIQLVQGMFKITQINESINTRRLFRFYSYTGTLRSYSVKTDLDLTDTYYDFLTGGIFSYLPPLERVEKKYLYKTSPVGSNYLPDQSSYTPAVDLIGTVPGESSYLFGSSEQNQGSVVIQRFTWGAGSPPTDMIAGYFLIRYRLDLIITNGVETRYLTNIDPVTGNVWEGVYYWADVPVNAISGQPNCVKIQDSMQYHTSGFYFKALPIGFLTPFNDLTGTCSGTFEFQHIGFFNTSGVQITIANLTFSFFCSHFRLSLWGGGTINYPDGEVNFRAYNANVNLKSKVLTFPDAHIGDGPIVGALGAITTYDGATWIPSTWWKIKKTGTQKKIHQLMVNEVIAGQQIPTDTYKGRIISPTYTPEKTLVFPDVTRWLVLNVTLDGKQDIWSGEWFKLNYQSVATQTGLWLSAGNYDPAQQWDLQSWTLESYTEEEEDNPLEPFYDSAGSLQLDVYNNSTSIFNVFNMLSVAILNETIAAGETRVEILVRNYLYQAVNNGTHLLILNSNYEGTEIVSISKPLVATPNIEIESKLFTTEQVEGSFIILLMSAYAEGAGSLNDHIEQTIIEDTEIVDVIPAGYKLNSLCIQNTTANAVMISAGTSLAGTNILYDEIIGANEVFSIQLGLIYSINKSVFFSSGNWNASSLDVVLVIEKIYTI